MKPVLFSFPLPWNIPLVGHEITFPAYFTLLTIGFGVAMWLTVREARRTRLDPQLILDANLWAIVWGIVGARVLHVIADGHWDDYVNLCVDPKKVPAIDALVKTCTSDAQCGYEYLCDAARHVCYPPKDCFAVFEVWRGGLAYYGGLIFAIAFCMRFLHKHKLPVLRVSDMAAWGIAFGLFFGRMGCFFNGCCHGKETASAVGVVFPRWSSPWRAQLDAKRITEAQAMLPVHPTQLYEAAACLAIFGWLYFWLRPRKRHDGDVLAAFLLLYAIARFVIEFFRDDERGVWGGISTSQIIAVPFVGFAIWLHRRVRRPRATA